MPKRAPKKWWDETFTETKKQYPDLPDERLRAIVGARWRDLPQSTKRRIRFEYEKQTYFVGFKKSNPRPKDLIDDITEPFR
jgi:hypothetical protein